MLRAEARGPKEGFVVWVLVDPLGWVPYPHEVLTGCHESSAPVQCSAGRRAFNGTITVAQPFALLDDIVQRSGRGEIREPFSLRSV